MSEAGSESVPKQMQPTFDAVAALTDAFCREHLNDEYAKLCRKAIAALCRKRPSPLANGRLESWACGIVHALGSHNFLFDRSNPLYMSVAELAAAFGFAASTAGNRAKVVRDALKIRQLDWHWSLPSQQDQYPGAWLIQVNGFLVDARHVTRDVQEEAFRRGLIPYMPAAADQA